MPDTDRPTVRQIRDLIDRVWRLDLRQFERLQWLMLLAESATESQWTAVLARLSEPAQRESVQ